MPKTNGDRVDQFFELRPDAVASIEQTRNYLRAEGNLRACSKVAALEWLIEHGVKSIPKKYRNALDSV